MKSRPVISMVLVATSLLAASSAALSSEKEVSGFVRALAVVIMHHCENNKISTVSVSFTGPASNKTTSDRLFIELLSKELAQRDIKVQSQAEFTVKGEFKFTKEAGIEVSAKILDRLGKEVAANFGGVLADDETVVRMLGLSVDLPTPKANYSSDPNHLTPIQRAIISAYENPKPAVVTSQLRASAASPVALQCLVEDVARPITLREGVPFVGLKKGENYTIKLTNDSPFEVAACVTVNGLNAFHFSDARIEDPIGTSLPKYSVVIVPAKKSTIIRGWYKDGKTTQVFSLASPELTARSKVDMLAKVGTINVTFRYSWADGSPRPDDEPETRRVVTKHFVPSEEIKPVFSVTTTRGYLVPVPGDDVNRVVGYLRGSITLCCDSAEK